MRRGNPRAAAAHKLKTAQPTRQESEGGGIERGSSAERRGEESNELLAFGQYTIIMVKRPDNSSNNIGSSSNMSKTETAATCYLQLNVATAHSGRAPRILYSSNGATI